MSQPGRTEFEHTHTIYYLRLTRSTLSEHVRHMYLEFHGKESSWTCQVSWHQALFSAKFRFFHYAKLVFISVSVDLFYSETLQGRTDRKKPELRKHKQNEMSVSGDFSVSANSHGTGPSHCFQLFEISTKSYRVLTLGTCKAIRNSFKFSTILCSLSLHPRLRMCE